MNSQVQSFSIKENKLFQLESDFNPQINTQTEENLYQQMSAFPTIVIHEVSQDQQVDGQQSYNNQTFEDYGHIQSIEQVNEQQIVNQAKKRDFHKNDPLNQQNQSQNPTKQQDKMNMNQIDEYGLSQGANQFNFKVVVHQVPSKQSIQEMEVPALNFDAIELDPLENRSKDVSLEKNHMVKPEDLEEEDQNEDFYVKFLQEKWAKREQTNHQNKLQASTQIKSSNSQQPLKQKQKNIEAEQKKVEQLKKTSFKVKKLKQDNSNSSFVIKSVKRPVRQSNQKFIATNLSELLPNESNFHRVNRKHLSNFQSAQTSVQKSQSRVSENKNIQYEFSMNNSVQMMSHILEDKCYNSLKKKSLDKFPKDQGKKLQESSNIKIRKIIKRSPYGILQIQVKDRKHSAKITNLRILKPKEMIRLKKIPKLNKFNKENQSGEILSTSNHPGLKDNFCQPSLGH